MRPSMGSFSDLVPIASALCMIIGLAQSASAGSYKKPREQYDRRSRVAGSSSADDDDAKFKSFVSIVVGDLNEGQIMPCSGVIFNEQQVLTSALCMQEAQKPENVLVATTLIAPVEWAKNFITPIRAKKVCKSPNFAPIKGANGVRDDFAIIQLESKIKFTEDVQKACFVRPELLKPGNTGPTVGIGQIREGVWARKAQKLYSRTRKCQGSDEHPSHICFESGRSDRTGSPCAGDLGAPTYMRMTKQEPFCVAGLTSYGDLSRRCGSREEQKWVSSNIYERQAQLEELSRECNVDGPETK